MAQRRYSYDRRKEAGGIDPQEDVTPLLPGLTSMIKGMPSQDIAHGAYAFDYLVAYNPDPRVKSFAEAIATEYAQRFADWLGYVFLNRANMSRASKPMKLLQEAMGKWVERIPSMLKDGHPVPISAEVPTGAQKFLKMDQIDKIGSKILRVVYQAWAQNQKTAKDTLGELPITYNKKTQRYEIPKGRMTYPHRNKLRDLGFSYDGEVWYTKTLEQKALRALPQAAQISREPAARPTGDPSEWFFEEWLPGNIDRFSKVFTGYGRSEGVPYEFIFTLNGKEVTVQFQRNIKTVDEAVAELKSRYGGSSDRDGWMLAVESWDKLKHSKGKAAIHAVDMANNLEHSHGAMMEHFPPGVRSWYPSFLDFKYTANAIQMVKKIRSEDLRVVAMELLPVQDRLQRRTTPKVDHRTPKGLALEVSSQPGKANKRKMLRQVKDRWPELYDDVVTNLLEKGLDLT